MLNLLCLPYSLGHVRECMHVDLHTLFFVLQQIKDTIKTETERDEHQQLSMFILVLMSHGTRGNVIMDSRGKPVALVEIQDMLSPDKFPAMKGKPKVIIVQACSGGESTFFVLYEFPVIFKHFMSKYM